MVMRLRVGDAEADRDDVEERRVGEFCAPTVEIVPGMEDELELARAGVIRTYQRLVGAAVCVGCEISDKLALRSVRQLVKLDPDAFGRSADRDVEDMGRNAGQNLLPRRFKRFPRGGRRHPSIAPARVGQSLSSCMIDMAAEPSLAIANCSDA